MTTTERAALTKQEARCLEALAYLEPGGWQSYMRLGLAQKAGEEDLAGLVARGLAEHRAGVPRTGEGIGAGRVVMWRLTRAGWALAREKGWPEWAGEEEGQAS
jgi:hypothetical protein